MFAKRSMEKSVTDSLVKNVICLRFNLDFVNKDTANFVTKKGKENNFFGKLFFVLAFKKLSIIAMY